MELAPPPPFRPPAWLRGAHAQTLFGAQLFQRAPRVGLGAPGSESFRIELDDGDALIAHARPGDSGAVLVLFHGLGGCADSAYVRRTALWASARGHAFVAVEHRGCGAGRGLARLPYHAGRSADVAQALAAVRARLPGVRRVAIGFSLSGNMLLRLLGRADGELPEAAIAVNPPVDLARAAELLARPGNRLYDLYYTRLCLAALRERVRDGTMAPRAPLARRAGLREFDEHVTAPLSGFDGADDYYRQASSAPLLARIERPTVVLAARDDPYVDPAPFERGDVGPGVHVHLERFGGHMGYVAAGARPFALRPWLDVALAHYVEALLAMDGCVRA